MALHIDFKSLAGLEFKKIINFLQSDDPDIQLALELLDSWDGEVTAESVGGAVYEVCRYLLFHSLLEPSLGKDLVYQIAGLGFNPYIYGNQEIYRPRYCRSPKINCITEILVDSTCWGKRCVSF